MKYNRLILGFGLLFHTTPAGARPAPGTAAAVNLVISVDWEGDALTPGNLKAVKQFRAKNPDIKIVHFLNAAYFTKPGARAGTVAAAMRSVLKEGDQLGLHLHGWESLFTQTGAPYRDSPSFWYENGSGSAATDGADRGWDIMISAYTVDELRSVLRYSLGVLRKNGFDGIKAFRAGGWTAAPNVLEALELEGFKQESSAVTVPLIEREAGDRPIYPYLSQLWPDINIRSLPYTISAGAGHLTEFPDTFALADYVTGAEAAGLYKRLAASKTGQKELYVHYGFHIETAALYLDRVQEAVSGIKAQAAASGRNLRSVVFDDLNP
ncbi:MAG: hypothetical protein WCW52_05040 [Elusimicrobiales bacterium]|jgi:hypothetical protein